MFEDGVRWEWNIDESVAKKGGWMTFARVRKESGVRGSFLHCANQNRIVVGIKAGQALHTLLDVLLRNK